jgi:hypothetical protein
MQYPAKRLVALQLRQRDSPAAAAIESSRARTAPTSDILAVIDVI